VPESELATVTLSSKAEERLGIELQAVEKTRLPEILRLGGELMSLPGYDVRIAAPAAGAVLNTARGTIPQAGTFVSQGQAILRLLLLPPELDIVGAREELVVTQEQYNVAKTKAERAEQLLESRAISEKQLEDIQVELTRARAALKAAEANVSLFDAGDLDAAAASLSTLVLESPVNGVLQRVMVTAGQAVPAATVLFEVARLDPVWVRVPVYVGDLSGIDREQPASVHLLGGRGSTEVFEAKTVQGPPLSDAASASADLYFELPNPDKLFRIGQKVGVSLIKSGRDESLAIPGSAILYDIHGNTWAYIQAGPHVFSRRRVEVSHFSGDLAVLARGLSEGDMVVTAGAAEIYGTEFGVGK
jgi:RND family efflux transporter MFP subunit